MLPIIMLKHNLSQGPPENHKNYDRDLYIHPVGIFDMWVLFPIGTNTNASIAQN